DVSAAEREQRFCVSFQSLACAGPAAAGFAVWGLVMHVEFKAKTRQDNSRSAAQTLRTPEKTKAPLMAKWVYTFGDGAAEGAAEMRDLLGGKGANLAEMANLGLPVPPGFTISTEVC